ncbi:MAG: hypothetical protein ABH884_02005 [Candidatus Komeilibacteria bacterium]
MNLQVPKATEQASEAVSNLSFAYPSWDIIVVLVFIAIAIIYAMTFGRHKVLVVLFSTYISLAIVNALPFVESLFASTFLDKLFIIKIVLFLVIFVLLYLVLKRSALLRYMRGSSPYTPFMQVVALSVVHAGLLLSIIVSFFPLELIDSLSFFTRNAFASEMAQFIWIVLPILTLGLIKKPSKKQLEAEEEEEEYE